MIAETFIKFTGTIDRKNPQDEGDYSMPVWRENWLCRNGRLQKPKGTTQAATGFSSVVRWLARYYSIETGVTSPKTFAYTDDGKLWVIDDNAGTATKILENLNTNAYPKHWLYKTQTQTYLFLVDGKDLFKYDGNNDNLFEKVSITDTDGNSIYPIDVIEHLDRLVLISNTYVYISANLNPTVFNDASDSIQLIVGSGKGENKALAKLGSTLYMFNTEGVYALFGDVISALASGFEIRLVNEIRCIASRSVAKCNSLLVFLADDYEIYAFDGNSTKILTDLFVLGSDISDVPARINKTAEFLKKCTATYYDHYYMLSFVEDGDTEPKVELFWDDQENKIDIVRGRNASAYMNTDPQKENDYQQIGCSDSSYVTAYTNRGYNFRNSAIISKLRTKDITPKRGFDLRFHSFYPRIEPTGDWNINVIYHLDGRSSFPTGSNAFFSQNLRGETKTLGVISIGNQSQFSGRILPKINYSVGESIAFEVDHREKDVRVNMLGIGITYIPKGLKKVKTIGG